MREPTTTTLFCEFAVSEAEHMVAGEPGQLVVLGRARALDQRGDREVRDQIVARRLMAPTIHARCRRGDSQGMPPSYALPLSQC